jgi:O-succinylbenzoic acid--CoA ligase
MGELILNTKPFSIEQLAKAPSSLNQANLSDYEKRVLRFCQQWLSGQETFTLNTSGSTGKPKAITITREQMATSARLTRGALGLRAGDRALVCLSADYIAGMMMLVRGFELGLHLTIISPTSNPLAQFSAEVVFDFTAFVPLQLQEILTYSPAKVAILNRMQGILVGGAPISITLQTQLQQVTAPIYHTYGMTETVSHIALKRLNGARTSDYFVPFEGVELGLDERGCLTIKSPLTGGKKLYTNDLVELRPGGSFIWLGRIDNVINTGGVKVQVEKVEMVLEKFLYQYQNGTYAGRRFFVGPLKHPRFGQAVVAVIEGRSFDGEMDLSPDTKAVIRRQLSKSLTKYEIPKEFYFIKHFLETPTGKIDRLANLEKIADQNL